MKNTSILKTSLCTLALTLVLGASFIGGSYTNHALGEADNVTTAEQWKATTTPLAGITQRIAGKPLILTGYGAGCAQFSATGTLSSTGINCGSGGSSTSTLTGVGTSTQVAFYASSTGLSSDSNFYWNNVLKFLGIQNGSPSVPLHVGNIHGFTVSSPPSLSYSLNLETSVSSPASASASQVTGPDVPSGFSTSVLEYVDNVQDAGFSSSPNYGETGFIANCQSINYNIFAYRLIGGTRVVNPNSLAEGTSDAICDGSTQFGVDISGWNTPNGYTDGYIIQRTDSSVGVTYDIDIGNTTSYSDQGFTNTDSFDTAVYPSNGTTYNASLAQYKNIAGSNYRTAFVTNGTYDNAIGGATYVIFTSSWSAPVNNGFMYQTNPGYMFDVGTATSFTDWGQNAGSVGDPGPFSSIAFPYFDQSGVSDGTFNTMSQNDGSGNCMAFGSNYYYKVVEYKTSPLDGFRYVTGGYTFSNTDNSDTSNFTWGIDINAGTGDGRVILISTDGGATYPYGADIGGGTHFDDDCTYPSSPDVTHSLGSYSGTTRNYSAYGVVSVPATKYSSTHNDYSFTDNNPTEGYIIVHSLATFGGATQMKIIESSPYRGPGYWYYSSVGTTEYQFNQGLNDNTVTPSTLGFLANGTNLHKTYNVYTKNTSPAIFSSSARSITTTDPNDGHFYTVTLNIGAVSGATFRINKSGVGYQDSATTTFQDDTTVLWNGSSTLTPTESLGSTAIFEKFVSSVTDPAILQLSSTNNGTVANSGIQFNYGTSSPVGNIAIDGNGTMDFTSNSNKFNFAGTLSGANPNVILSGGSGQSNVFNNQQLSSVGFLVKSQHNAVTFFIDPSIDTAWFGRTASIDPASTASFFRSIGGDTDATFITEGTVSGVNGKIAWSLKDSNSGSVQAELSDNGWLTLGGGSQLATVLQLAGETNTAGQLVLNNASANLSTPMNGDISRDDSATNGGLLHYTTGSTRRNILLNITGAGAGDVWRSDTNGNPVESNALNINTGLGLIIHNIQDEFKQNATFDSGRTLTFGSGGNLALGGASFNATYALKATNYTLGATDYLINVASTSPVTLTLPNASVAVGGRYYIIKNTGVGTVTLNTSTTTQFFDGVATTTTLSQNDYLQLETNGTTSWFITAKGNPNYFSTASTTATSTFAGYFAVGTSTNLTSRFTIAALANESALIIKGIISGVVYIFQKIDAFGHVITSGPAPAVTSCGTGSPTVTGNDRAGTITTGTAASACTLTFANAYPVGSTVVCNISTNSTVSLGDISSVSTSAVSFGLSAALTGGTIYYQCSATQ